MALRKATVPRRKPHGKAPRGRCGWLCLALLLAACQTNEDPREGGFVDGVVGLTTGGYDDYVDGKEDALQAEQEDTASLDARAKEIEIERAALAQQINSAEARLADLRDQLAKLRQQLAASTEATAAQRARLTEAEERAARADREINAFNQQDDLSLAAQKRKIDELQALIGSVATMVAELSG